MNTFTLLQPDWSQELGWRQIFANDCCRDSECNAWLCRTASEVTLCYWACVGFVKIKLQIIVFSVLDLTLNHTTVNLKILNTVYRDEVISL
jgi:hypothetical protein